MRSLGWALRLTFLASLGTCAVAGPVSGAATAVPYNDSNAVGYIGLCNQAGQQITTGSISATPFVGRAVSSQPAPAAYSGAQRTASLYAFLPIQALPPGDWSGEALSSASLYSNSKAPMVQPTVGDGPLSYFTRGYPPQWDGFIQLRMYLGYPGQAAYDRIYPALNLLISGDTWTAVGGGPVNCTAGNVQSLENIPQTATTTTPSSGGASATGSSSSNHPSGSGATSGSGTKSNSQSNSKSNSSASSGQGSGGNGATSGTLATSTTSSKTPLVIAILILFLIAAAVAALLLTRRFRTTSPDPLGESGAQKGHPQ